MNVSCSKCPAQYAIPDAKVRGKKAKIKCKHCGAPIVVDGTKLGPAPAAAAKPVAAKPAAAKPTAKPTPKPAAAKPAAKPVAAKPAAAKPAAKPVAAKPAAKPAVVKPAAKPAVAKPAVARPAVARPAVARPAVARPAVARPAVARPTVPKPVTAPPSAAAGVRTPSYRPRPEWTVAINDQDHTEMATPQLVELFAIGTVKPTTLIWREGMETWRTAFQIPEIAEALTKRGFKPPDNVSQDFDPLDASWGAEEASSAGTAPPPPAADIPPELQGAIVGRGSDAPAAGSRRITDLSDFDEPTVAVDTAKLLGEQDPKKFQVDTLRPPPGQAPVDTGVDEEEEKTVAMPSPLSAKGLDDLAASLDRQIGTADYDDDDDEKTVARSSPLLDEERRRMAARIESRKTIPDDRDTTTPSRSSPLSQMERERLAARLDKMETGKPAPATTPTPAAGMPAMRGVRTDTDRPAEAPRSVPWAGGMGAMGAKPGATGGSRSDLAPPRDGEAAVSVRGNVDVGIPAGAIVGRPERRLPPVEEPKQPPPGAFAETVLGQPAPVPPPPADEDAAPAEPGAPEQPPTPEAEPAASEQQAVAAVAPASAAVVTPPKKKGSAAGAFALGLLVLLLLGGGGAAAAVVLAPDAVAKYVPIDLSSLGVSATPTPPPKPSPPEPPTAAADEPAVGEPEASASASSAPAEEPGADAGEIQADDVGDGSIDRAKAKRALGIAAGGAANCNAGPAPRLAGQVEVTFSAAGNVTFVRLSGELLGSPVESCVKQNFWNARVPAFTGTPITLGRVVVVPARAETPAPAPAPAPEPAPEPPPAAPQPEPEPAPAAPDPGIDLGSRQ